MQHCAQLRRRIIVNVVQLEWVSHEVKELVQVRRAEVGLLAVRVVLGVLVSVRAVIE